ncbi:hydrophobic protein [Kitasatospora sp. NPDC087314]|uniref:hydrophobic protein n=1 Tax=Kitasatospora sp. NPDC087314 TaxID=3364068 RepID=UPI0038221970
MLVLALLLALILGGAGFAIHILWWIALAVLVLRVLCFVFTDGGAGGRRWYRW